jgi:hypothetical protein
MGAQSVGVGNHVQTTHAMNRTELLEKYPNASEAFLRRNSDFAQGQPAKTKRSELEPGASRVCEVSPDRIGGSGYVSPSQEGKTVEAANQFISTDEAKLNKTERARLSYLSRLPNVQRLHTQALTLKLAHDCRLTPDFFYLDTDQKRFVAEDVKGFQREDALIKMKVAARMFPEFAFQIVFKAKDGWTVKEVKP